ncbi:NUDIX hydrolase [Loigolactobacillus iwatensis]|uniref:NUDIX hydrolase n=1 Tax=Loigolactobacillus iwatensis TaxID=1267156 RepID=UPI000F7EDF45|nr:NUDIX hydrolase [Loigolactobacillus iwatensis]
MKFEEKVLTTKKLFHGVMLDLEIEEVQLPNQQKATREIIRHPGAAAIMPVTNDGRMIFVEQWREPLRQVTYEIPAGKLDQRDATPEDAAWRELNEETGFTSDQLTLVCQFFSSPGFADEQLWLYRADNIWPVEKQLPQDQDEFLQLHPLTLQEAKVKQQEGKICDAKTVIALQQWELAVTNNK